MTDFLIIGGGIAGISAAARLSHLGQVTVLEAEAHLAHHASGRSAALYEPFYGLKPVVGLSIASGDYFRGQDKILSPRGLMILARAHEAEALRAEAESFELPAISVEEARAIVPVINDSIAHAAYGDHAWDIDTDLLIQTFAREAKANGGQIVTGARVTAIALQPGEELYAMADHGFEGQITILEKDS